MISTATAPTNPNTPAWCYPTEDIIARDLEFMEQRMGLAARQLGSHIVEPFHREFATAYGKGQL